MAVEVATAWVADFVRSGFVAALRAPEYLTVSLPVEHPDGIQGVRIVERARGLLSGETRPVSEEEEGRQTWRLDLRFGGDREVDGTDVQAVQEGYVAIVPMRVDEADAKLKSRLRTLAHQIPPVQRAPAEASSQPSPR